MNYRLSPESFQRTSRILPFSQLGKTSHRLLRFLSVIITLSISAILIASIPAGAVQYKITPIVTNTNVAGFIHINNNGQIVWASNYSGGQFPLNLYNNGTITQIGDDFSPGCLDINDRGEIVWGAMSGGGFYLYSSETISKIASGIGVGWLKINNKSQIVYVSNGTDIYLYSNGTSTPIHVGGGGSNIDPDINDKGQIVWSGYDGNEFQIYLHDNGTTTKLTNYNSATGNSQSLANPKINNNGQVVWTGYDTNSGYNIYLWESDPNGGKTTKISNGGSDYYPDINDFGQVVWMGGTSTYLLNINNPGNNPIPIEISKGIIPKINNSGQIVYCNGMGTEIYLATPQAINVPIPTAYPPINSFPQAPDLWTNSPSFITNNKSAFSPDSQQFFNDNQNALQRFISKFITSPGGLKASANLWKDAFANLGEGLSYGAIGADMKQSIAAGTQAFLLHAGKALIFNNLLHMENDAQIRAYVDVLTSAHIPTNPYSFIFSGGSLFSKLYTEMCGLIANDPPDPNYTEVYQCPIAITAPFNLPGVFQDMNQLLGQHFESVYSTYYYLLGLTTSINRYSSALAANDAASAALQFEAFVAYLTLYDKTAIQHADLKRQLKQALVNQGVADTSYNKQNFLNLQNQIKQNGLPAEVITAFKNAGLTDQQIADLKQAAIDFVLPDSVPGTLFSNYSSGVDLLHKASSWRAPNPGLFLLLMD